MSNAKKAKLKVTAFTAQEEQIAATRQVAEDLGINLSEAIRRCLNIGIPALRESAKYTRGVKREVGGQEAQ
jgi:hypothetical protein